MRMVAWVGGRKSPYTPSIRPYTSEYTAVSSEVYGKNTSPILRVYCPIPQKVYIATHRCACMELAFWFFDPPPIFRVLNSFFYIPWAHGTTRYMCQNGCFGGVLLVCQIMLTIRETGTKLPRKFVLGIPLLDPLGKRVLLQAVVSTFQISTQVPALYREFLCKFVVCVCKSTPSVMSVCQSYKPELTTDAFERKLRDNEWHCNFIELHAKFGVPLVNGHVFTRNFRWLGLLSPAFEPEVFEQNMKNRSVPSWRAVSHTLAKEMNRALTNLHFLSPASRATLTAHILNEAQKVFVRATSQCPRKHHVSVVQQQVKLLPPSFVLGPFDKGTSKLWMACEGYFFPQFHSNFYQAPKRFTEIIRSQSHLHASTELYNYLVSGAGAYLRTKVTPQPPVPLCDPLRHCVTERLTHISSLVKKHNAWCKENQKPKQAVLPMSNECRGFLTQLVDQGSRKLKSCKNQPCESQGTNSHSVRSLTRTPRERLPGVARGAPPQQSHTNVCDCRWMVRPPPEPPPDQPPCAR